MTQRRAVRLNVPSPAYFPWNGMVARCTKPHLEAYKKYGARGISVCKDWIGPAGFERFVAHIGPRPTNKHQIDRIDSTGNYEPGNVRWATTQEQARNRSSNQYIEFDGKLMCEIDWANSLGITHQSLQKRLARWPLEKALTQKPRSCRHPISAPQLARLTLAPRDWGPLPNWQTFRLMRPLLRAGLIEMRQSEVILPGWIDAMTTEEYRITPAGRTALQASDGGE